MAWQGPSSQPTSSAAGSCWPRPSQRPSLASFSGSAMSSKISTTNSASASPPASNPPPTSPSRSRPSPSRHRQGPLSAPFAISARHVSTRTSGLASSVLATKLIRSTSSGPGSTAPTFFSSRRRSSPSRSTTATTPIGPSSRARRRGCTGAYHASPRALILTRPRSDHDELRYSIRSVIDNFKSPGSRFHLLTTDFSIPDAYATKSNISEPELWRLGQLPQWLDCDRRVGSATWRDEDHELIVSHHAQFFKPYNGAVFNRYVARSVHRHPNTDA